MKITKAWKHRLHWCRIFINRSSELNYVDTYFDNGFTGTNFKRPAFTRLMNDVRQKKIKCIVVKDLSRFWP